MLILYFTPREDRDENNARWFIHTLVEPKSYLKICIMAYRHVYVHRLKLLTDTWTRARSKLLYKERSEYTYR